MMLAVALFWMSKMLAVMEMFWIHAMMLIWMLEYYERSDLDPQVQYIYCQSSTMALTLTSLISIHDLPRWRRLGSDSHTATDEISGSPSVYFAAPQHHLLAESTWQINWLSHWQQLSLDLWNFLKIKFIFNIERNSFVFLVNLSWMNDLPVGKSRR